MMDFRLRFPVLPSKFRWLIVALTLGIIFYYSIVPSPGPDRLEFGPLGILPLSIWLHWLAYAGLATTFAYVLVRSPRPHRRVLLGVFLVVTGYGIGIEAMQFMLPDRTFDVIDILVNSLGAAITVMVWNIVVQYVEFYPIRWPSTRQSAVE